MLYEINKSDTSVVLGWTIDDDSSNADEPDEVPQTPQSFLFVYKQVFNQASQVFIVFFITFIIFPGVTNVPTFSFLKNLDKELKGTWNSLIPIVIFNVFDTLGRYMGGCL